MNRQVTGREQNGEIQADAGGGIAAAGSAVSGQAHRSSIRRNVAWLFLLQGASGIFPLLTLPWFTRTLGPAGFGRTGFATAVCAYFTLIADYGFNLSATRQIAIHRDDRQERSRIFSVTITTKGLLAVGGFILLLVLAALVPRLRREFVLLVTGYLSVVGAVITPIWYFQGIERMAVISMGNVLSRTAALPLVFALVRGPGDMTMALALTGAPSVLAGLVSLAVLVSLRHVDWVPPSRASILDALRSGWHVFISTAAISLYTVSSTVVLGFVAGDSAVGLFSGAQRLVGAAQLALSPLSQSVYPRISYLMHHARDEGFLFLRKILRLLAVTTGLLSIFVFVAAGPLVTLALGSSYHVAATTLRWMAPLPFLIGLSNVLGIQTMLPLGMNATFSRILIGAGLFHVSILIPLGALFGASGAGASVLAAEFAVTAAMAIHLRRSGVPFLAARNGEGSRRADEV